MGKSKKNTVTVKLNIPEKYFGYITQAHAIDSHYKLANKLPVNSLENFCLSAILYASQSVHKVYQEELVKRNKEMADANVDKTNTEGAGVSAENTDTDGSED